MGFVGTMLLLSGSLFAGHGGVISHVTWHGREAEIQLAATVPTVCTDGSAGTISFQINASVDESATLEATGVDTANLAGALVFIQSSCTSGGYVMGKGQVVATVYQQSSVNYANATVNLPIYCVDDNSLLGTLAYDLAWTGTGAQQKQHDDAHRNMGFYVLIDHSNATYRSATVTGTATFTGAGGVPNATLSTTEASLRSGSGSRTLQSPN